MTSISSASPAARRIIGVYLKATTVKSGRHFTTVNELTDQLPATAPGTLKAALQLLMDLGPIMDTVNIVLSEEDKGAVLAGLFSVEAGRPLAMARHYTYGAQLLPSGAVIVPVAMEYLDGHLMVCGITPGDEVLLLDDTLSTGGTAVSLIRAVHAMGAHVVEMRVVTEKLGFGGRQKIMNEVGLNVKAAIGIVVSDQGRITIGEVMGERVGAYGNPL